MGLATCLALPCLHAGSKHAQQVLQGIPFEAGKALMQKNLRGELSVVASEVASTKSGFLRQLANAMG